MNAPSLLRWTFLVSLWLNGFGGRPFPDLLSCRPQAALRRPSFGGRPFPDLLSLGTNKAHLRNVLAASHSLTC